ncbi:hypothetical protein [Methylophilus aquaticus]|uniref:Uncharacterized protein n=1 Tax=Methylophilus aquaticus TaxID=1971610 RepID=A0ABT9JRV8_9PROT|nr:hypothetical protein [Methylophilus aquaticus]MDP8566846.1 hypothetical protein [Methylophilus aquaticus]
MKFFTLTVSTLLLTLTWHGAMAETSSSLVIQVPESFYKHPVRLLNPYLNYWHNRAEAAEAVGLSSFQSQHFTTSSCETEAKGQALVVIEPNMFYNPQTGVFYSEITAKVYTQSAADSALGKPLMTVKGQGQSRGWLTHNVEYFTHQSYQQAFDQIIQQLQQSTAFQQSVAQAPVQTYQALCTSIDTLSQPKLFF